MSADRESVGDALRRERVAAEAARAEARARDRLAKAKPCRLCGAPMLVGQKVVHVTCGEAAGWTRERLQL